MNRLLLSIIMLHLFGCSVENNSNAPKDSVSSVFIEGIVTPFLGLIAQQNPSFLNSFDAYAATCGGNPVKAKLYGFKNDGTLEDNPIDEYTLDVDAKYRFNIQALGISLSTVISHAIVVSGCSRVYFSPLFETGSSQNIDETTSLLGLMLQASGSNKLNQISRSEAKTLAQSLSGSSLSNVYTNLIADATTSNSFQSLFGVTATTLQNSAPIVTLDDPSISLQEGTTYTYAPIVSHSNGAYNTVYDWKLDGSLKSTSSSWSYTPKGNEHGSHTITLSVGQDDGGGSVDTTKAYYTKSFSISIANNITPSAPSFSLNTPASSPVTVTNLTLDINTGASLANCDSFQQFALSEQSNISNVPSGDFTTCSTNNTQTENFTLTAGEGSKTIYLWAKDSDGNTDSSTLTVTLDLNAPTASISNISSTLSVGQAYTISFSAADTVGLSTLALYYAADGTNYSLVSNLSTSATSYNWTVPDPGSDISTAKLKITATDNAGQATSAETTAFNINAVPVVTISSPAAAATISPVTIAATPFSGTCSDVGTNVDISGAVTATTTCNGGGVWSTNLDLSTPALGNVSITFSQTDSVGTGSSSITVNKVAFALSAQGITPSYSTGVTVGNTATFTATSDYTPTGGQIAWLVDGSTSAYLVDGSAGTSMQATLTADASLLGAKTITLNVGTGNTKATYTWNLSINYFNNHCNHLEQGQHCTLIGRPGFGSGSAPTNNSIQLQKPRNIVFDSNNNVLFSDSLSTGIAIWYYNRSGGNVNTYGQTLADNTLTVVAGGGYAYQNYPTSSGINLSGSWRSDNQGPMTIDSSTNKVYTTSLRRIYEIDPSTNNFSVIADSTTTNYVDFSIPKAIRFFNDAGTKKLYLAGNNSLMYYDMNADAFNLVLGDGTSATSGDGGLASAAQTQEIYDVKIDSRGNIYFTSYYNCTIRVICKDTSAGICANTSNISSGELTPYAAVVTTSPSLNYVYKIAGSTCGTTDNVNPFTHQIYYPSTLAILNDGGVVFYDNLRRIYYLNTSNANQTVAGVTINKGELGIIAGTYNSTGVPTTGVSAITTTIGYNANLELDPTDNNLLVSHSGGDYNANTGYIHKLDLTTGHFSLFAGSSSSKSSPNSGTSYANTINTDAIDSFAVLDNGEIVYSDYSKGPSGGSYYTVIQDVSTAGIVTSKTPSSGVSGTENDTIGNIYLKVAQVHKGPSNSVFISENYSTISQYIAFWNRTSSPITVNNINVAANYFERIAGVATGAGSSPYFSGNNGSATSAEVYNPKYINYVGTDLYFIDQQNYCLRKVDSSNIITHFSGQEDANNCVLGSTIDDEAINISKFSSNTKGLTFDSLGNYAVWNQGSSNIIYGNTTGSDVNAYGSTILAGKVKIISGDGASSIYSTGITAINLNTSNGQWGDVDMVFDSNDNLYVLIGVHGIIKKFDRTTGNMTNILGSSAAATNYPLAHFTYDSSLEGVDATTFIGGPICSLQIDSNDDLYYSDCYDGGIHKIKNSSNPSF